MEFVGRGSFLLEIRDYDLLLGPELLNFVLSCGQIVVQSVHLATHSGELIKLAEIPGCRSVEQRLGCDQILNVVRTEGCCDHVAATRRIRLQDDELCAVFERVDIVCVLGEGGLELLYAPFEIVDLSLDALHLLKIGFEYLVSVEQRLEGLFLS